MSNQQQPKQQHNQGNQKQHNTPRLEAIETTLIDLKPTLMGFTLTHRDLEETVRLILDNAGVSYRGTTVEIDYDANNSPILEQYIFFSSDDKTSIYRKGGKGGSKRSNPILMGKMPTGGIRLEHKVAEAIKKIALPDGQTRAIQSDNGLTVVPIDPYAVISYALNAEPGLFSVILTGIDVRNDTILINAIKRLERGGFNPKNSSDQFSRALDQIRRRNKRR